ncbi:carbohydrate ABC transporter permease [bacterium]|nr:carbohydrate ABC transporter permease [bacterium]
MIGFSPFRIVAFAVLLLILVVGGTAIIEQLLRFGSMVAALFFASTMGFESGSNSSKAAGELMLKFAPVCTGTTYVVLTVIVMLVLTRWMRTSIQNRGNFLRTMFLYESLIIGSAIVLFPFFWMLATSFKPQGTELIMKSNPFDVIPDEPTITNFKKVLKLDAPPPGETGSEISPTTVENQKNFGTFFKNSLIISTIAAFFVTLFSAMGGYVFAKKELPYKKTLFAFFMGTMMIPGMMYMVPQFFIICKLGLFGTRWAMFLPHLASVFGVFMFKQFMDTIPTSLIEAARIDGASEYQVFRVLIIPLSMPIALTLFLLTFLFHWSNFLWQLIVTDFEAPLSITLPVGLALFKGQYSMDLSLIMSASCFSIVPIVVLFLFAQRYFIEGMTSGAVKE